MKLSEHSIKENVAHSEKYGRNIEQFYVKLKKCKHKKDRKVSQIVFQICIEKRHQKYQYSQTSFLAENSIDITQFNRYNKQKILIDINVFEKQIKRKQKQEKQTVLE